MNPIIRNGPPPQRTGRREPGPAGGLLRAMKQGQWVELDYDEAMALVKRASVDGVKVSRRSLPDGRMAVVRLS